MIRTGTSKRSVVLYGEKRKTLCTRPLSIVSPRVSKIGVKAKTQPWPPGYKHDMKYERERRCVSERRGGIWAHMPKYSTLSHWGVCVLLNAPRPYHNKWPSHDFVAWGWRKHKEMKPMRIREETQHYTSTLRPHYQTQFSLFTMPDCPVAKADFLFFFALMGKKPPNKSIFLERLILAVGCHGYPMWSHVPRSKRQRGGKGKSKTHNSKQLLLPWGDPWSPWKYTFFTHVGQG